jgi:hypothetical protein
MSVPTTASQVVPTTKCSNSHREEYKNAINQYLTSKGITDFSKYNISFKNDKLHYVNWEYPGIDKPIDIQPLVIQKVPNVPYEEMYQRIIYFDLSIRPIPQHTTINARGMLGSNNINNEQIIEITGLDIELSNFGYVVERDQILTLKFRLLNGLLRTNSEINKSDLPNTNFTGKIRILIFYIK